MDPKILAAIRRTCYPFQSRMSDRFVDHLRQVHPHSLKAVVAYGSRLSQVTASSSSIFDFFVVCGEYDRFYRRTLLAWLNRWLPPNIMGTRLNGAFGGPGPSCKYNVISLRRLEQETRLRPREFYLLGRFSKRMGICWADNRRTVTRLVRVFYRAMETMAALSLCQRRRIFDREAFIRGVLGLSYQGDERVEAEDKVDRLYRAERPFYDEVYGRLLNRFVDRGWLERRGPDRFELLLDDAARARQQGRLARLVHQSRLRGRLRWAKYIFTFDDWVDYMIDKVERSTGWRIELTEAERRHPILHAIKYYLRLRRRQMLT